jgi:hypothetical protein
MRNRVRIGLIAVAMTVAAAGRGCVTPPPTAESLVAEAAHPAARSSLTSGDAATPPVAPSTPQAQEASSKAGAEAGGETPPAAQTSDERRAALDKQLNDSLGAFDARLQKEQRQISEERDARQATVAAATASANDSDAPPGSKTNKRGESRTPHAGDLKSDKPTGATGSASGNGAPAIVTPDGNDDDIVARRIRKAAEQETDPELKDKLWKEYVEYKKNSQVR